MGKYLSKYQTKEDYYNNKDTHSKPHVSFIVNAIKQLIYIPKPYIEQYFTIVALEDDLTVSLSQNACDYRIDNGDWINLSANTATPSINSGQKISFKITNPTINLSSYGIGTFTVNKAFNVEGNIMSLLYGDNFEGQNDLSGKNYAFRALFYNCTTLQNAENLILPATTLTEWCYSFMFQGCTSLTSVPALPATTLVDYCYESMFEDCISLTTTMSLPATTLTNECYMRMFYGCTSLMEAPALPATTLARDCYYSMFYGCTSLTSAPELPASNLADDCYESMFEGCTSLTEAPELPATTLAFECYCCMFKGCTSLTEAPILSGTTLTDYCYDGMFSGCTSLTTAPELPATALREGCYQYMFSGCTKLNKITMLATNIRALSGCLTNWVKGVGSTGTFIKDKNMTTLPSGESGIPTGWTVKNYNESNLITFTIDGTEYQAEEGMTWEEWVNSDYNTIGYIICGDGYVKNPNKNVHSLYIPGQTNATMGSGPMKNHIIENCQIYKNASIGEPCMGDMPR